MKVAYETFLALYEQIQGISGPTHSSRRSAEEDEKKLFSFPTSSVQLARILEGDAKHFESAHPLFERLAQELFGRVERFENLLWIQPYEDLAETLKRSSFYHGVRRNEAPKKLWDRLQSAITDRPIQAKTLLCLAGCYLTEPVTIGHFRFTQHPERDELDGGHFLGPPATAEDFYPDEAIQLQTACTWLAHTHELDLTRVDFLHRTAREDGDLVLDKYWPLILPIALYNCGFFRVPIIAESVADWRLIKVRSADPNDKSLDRYLGNVMAEGDWTDGPNPRRWLVVSEDRWDSFLRFRRATHEALAKSASWESVGTACKEYLRARFVDCPDPNEQEVKDCVLHYVVALEKLLLLPEERKDQARQFSFRAALAVADDGERPQVTALTDQGNQENPPLIELLKRAYNYRSRIVHSGGQLEIREIIKDLPMVRDVCRRAFAGMLLATANFADEAKFGDYRRGLRSSLASQELAGRFAKQVLELSGRETSG